MKDKRQIEFENDQIKNIEELNIIEKRLNAYMQYREELMNYAKTSQSTSVKLKNKYKLRTKRSDFNV